MHAIVIISAGVHRKSCSLLTQ